MNELSSVSARPTDDLVDAPVDGCECGDDEEEGVDVGAAPDAAVTGGYRAKVYSRTPKPKLFTQTQTPTQSRKDPPSATPWAIEKALEKVMILRFARYTTPVNVTCPTTQKP